MVWEHKRRRSEQTSDQARCTSFFRDNKRRLSEQTSVQPRRKLFFRNSKRQLMHRSILSLASAKNRNLRFLRGTPETSLGSRSLSICRHFQNFRWWHTCTYIPIAVSKRWKTFCTGGQTFSTTTPMYKSLVRSGWQKQTSSASKSESQSKGLYC